MQTNGPRSDCSEGSSLNRAHGVCFHGKYSLECDSHNKQTKYSGQKILATITMITDNEMVVLRPSLKKIVCCHQTHNFSGG